jgi:Xaa-Pro aminopeptidase
MIKSPAEIECLRKACRITADAYAATFAAAREGMLESEIYATMHRLLDRPDTGDVFLVITSGEGNYDLVTKPPEDRPVRRGDMVWMDAGCTISGYWSDYSRAGVVGRPSAEQMHAQEAVHRITSDAVARVRPGVAASSIARFCLDQIEQLDFPLTSTIAKLAARIGHGIGLNLTEPPHLGCHDDTLLEPGMVVSLEPGVATSYGTFHVEENVLVTEDGCEILSGASRELSTIGGEANR